MPTYSYRCTECGTAFDIQQAFTDDALTECPTCGGLLRKQFGNVGVTFNGSGFYRTDSRAKPTDGAKKDGAKKSEGAATGTSSKSEGTAAPSTSSSSSTTSTASASGSGSSS
jgi:putative FmdB family regulatory protein